MFRCALITGSTSGVGRECVALLSQKKIPLLLTGRNLSALETLKKEYNPLEICALDLSSSKDVAQLKNVIDKRVPDLVINCAGYGLYGEAIDSDIDDLLTLFDVNARATIEITLHAAKKMVEHKKKGVILNVSSLAGEYSTPLMTLYGSAKAAVTHFSQSLDFELAPYGLRVLVSCPGMIRTPFSSKAASKEVRLEGHTMSSKTAAYAIWKQIEARKPKQIIDGYHRLLSCLGQCLPTKMVQKMVWKKIKKRL